MCYGGLLFKEEESSNGLLSGTKVVFFWSDCYKTWSSRKIGTLVVVVVQWLVVVHEWLVVVHEWLVVVVLW